MIYQDYIMRMIEQFIKGLVKIISKKNIGNYQDAFSTAEITLKNITGFDFNFIESLSDKEIISLLNLDKELLGVKCIIIGKLLKEKTELKELNGEELYNLIHDYHKSLNMFLEGFITENKPESELNTYTEDINFILNKIRGYELPAEIKYKLFKYYFIYQEYDNAENKLFELKEISYPNISNEGILFYEKLGKLSDNELKERNFSREEVLNGLHEFLNT